MVKARRITDGGDLGRSRRSLDLILGSLAVLPLVGASIDLFIPSGARDTTSALAILWSGTLLAFFAGVRRGLTFSEAEGGSLGEIASMLALFALGFATLVLMSPLLGAAGFLILAVLDARAADQLEAPAYFRVFRPLQMGVAALCLVVIRIRMQAGA